MVRYNDSHDFHMVSHEVSIVLEAKEALFVLFCFGDYSQRP